MLNVNMGQKYSPTQRFRSARHYPLCDDFEDAMIEEPEPLHWRVGQKFLMTQTEEILKNSKTRPHS